MWINRKALLQEREAAAQAIAAQKELIAGQEQAIKGLRGYMQIKEEMLFDSIDYLIASLREYMPAEKDVPRNEEPAEWYRAVNAIFLAEKRVREIKESR